jgi:hypothetical protein
MLLNTILVNKINNNTTAANSINWKSACCKIIDTTIGHSTPSASEESTLCRFWHGRRERRATVLIESKPRNRRAGRLRPSSTSLPKAGQTAACDAALLARFLGTVLAVYNHSLVRPHRSLSTNNKVVTQDANY